MALNSSISRVLNTLSSVSRRNFGSCYILAAKASDPIQQLFLDKLTEFKQKSSDKNFLKDNPALEKQLKDELNRVTKQYGGEKPEDLAQFPQIKLEEPKVDPQPGF
ncbi:ATP synthase-coupling factor 6, mitochondrial [Planococcus citri]|uniref:ATP synthase-coupling factor 6, mitochondrial n=1 Tax=Planococcus citri TaxID=170843 RepID=UPI0031F80993